MRRVREIYAEVLRLSVNALALVHDWLTGMRGGEKVLEVLCERYPDAELFTLVHVPRPVSPAIERLRIAHLVRAAPAVRPPLLPRSTCRCSPPPSSSSTWTASTWSSASATARPSRSSRPGRARHLCYCLTPMRYAWDQFDAYFGPERVGTAGQPGAAAGAWRGWRAGIAATAGRVDRYVAISHYVAGRIRRYYNRQATVVYPPVDTDFLPPRRPPCPTALRAGRVGAGPLQAARPGDRGLPRRPACR